LILVVETAVLVPSAIQFRQTELHRLSAIAETAVESLLAVGTPETTDLASGFSALVGQMHVAGLAAFLPNGSRIGAAGEPVRTSLVSSPEALGTRPQSTWQRGDRYEVAWRVERGKDPMIVVARMNTSEVADNLYAYILRVAGLVVLIVTVVTAGTMVVLNYKVLRPILRLRDSIVGASAQPDIADQFAVHLQRHDEIGELSAAHNAMLGRVAQARQRDREIAAERARHLARHDALTALPNRTALIEYLDQQRSMQTKHHFSTTLILINIASFGLLNAAYGTANGDAVLKTFAARLKRCAGPQDFVAHLGVDLFALARIGALAVSGVSALADRIQRKAEKKMEVAGDHIPMSVHIGIAHVEGDCIEPLAFLGQADLAVERARAEGDGRYQFFSDAMTEEARTRQRLAHDLERALEAGELFLAYQPKVAIGDRTVGPLAGAEALLRWKHPVEGFIRPDIFIPVAESTGLIAPLGDFVLRAACRQIREWLDSFGWSPKIAVNLSARQFSDPGLKAQIEGVLRESAIPADLLELEITESAAMDDVKKALAG
jgi:diguanylate cyclase (GGDEF)-like protein